MAFLLRKSLPIAYAARRPSHSLTAAFATMPTAKPCPDFSSGPCKKRPGWTTDVYKTAATGRSHRSKIGKSKLKKVDTVQIAQTPLRAKWASGNWEGARAKG